MLDRYSPYSNNNIHIVCAFTIFFCCIVAGCIPSISSKTISRKIVEAQIGETTYYIPKAYLTFGYTSYSKNGFFIQAFYPGSSIVVDDIKTLHKQGEWWKNVSMLLDYAPNSKINFNDFALNRTNSLHATKIVGNEYGLIHMTQPPDQVQDYWDVWFEMKEDEIVSYITCSDKITEIDFPQCTHVFWLSQKVSLRVNYSKRLLPEWQKIQGNAMEMLESFKAKDTAQSFLEKRISELSESNQ